MGLTEQAAEVWVIIVAAGAGSRFGAPKQFIDLGGMRVVDHAVATAARHATGVVVVLPAEPSPDQGPIVAPDDTKLVITSGATSRAGSVRRGLDLVPADADVVLVHDGARPLATDAIYESVISAVLSGAEAVVPAVAVTDTIRRRGGEVVDRSELVAVQTPQGFRAETLRSAHAAGGDATDDATLVEVAGGTVVVVDGDRRNIKITSPLDLDIAAALILSEASDD